VLKNYYQILCISPNANITEIKKAYDQLENSLALTIDSNRTNRRKTLEILKNISDAYETLSDPVKRAHYDQSKNKLRPYTPIDPLHELEEAIKNKQVTDIHAICDYLIKEKTALVQEKYIILAIENFLEISEIKKLISTVAETYGRVSEKSVIAALGSADKDGLPASYEQKLKSLNNGNNPSMYLSLLNSYNYVIFNDNLKNFKEDFLPYVLRLEYQQLLVTEILKGVKETQGKLSTHPLELTTLTQKQGCVYSVCQTHIQLEIPVTENFVLSAIKNHLDFTNIEFLLAAAWRTGEKINEACLINTIDGWTESMPVAIVSKYIRDTGGGFSIECLKHAISKNRENHIDDLCFFLTEYDEKIKIPEQLIIQAMQQGFKSKNIEILVKAAINSGEKITVKTLNAAKSCRFNMPEKLLTLIQSTIESMNYISNQTQTSFKPSHI